MLSLLPWGDVGLAFTSDVCRSWTILDEWRVAEVEEPGSRRLAEVVARLKQVECLTIYNDKHLWLAFKFLHKHGKETRIEIAPELEHTMAMCLRANSLQYFGKDLPYIPNHASPFDDTYVITLIAWT